MFYKMIENKRNQWLNSDECTVQPLIEYMVKSGQMRDVQIDAVKTYLFLKIFCENKPLVTLFKKGCFNSLIRIVSRYPTYLILSKVYEMLVHIIIVLLTT